MHYDERAYLVAGLAHLMQLKYGMSGRISGGAANSSYADTVEDGVPTSDRIAALGFQTRTEGVAE